MVNLIIIVIKGFAREYREGFFVSLRLRGCLHNTRMILIYWYKFIPVSSCGSVFTYMIQTQNHITVQDIAESVLPDSCTRLRFSYQYKSLYIYHVSVV